MRTSSRFGLVLWAVTLGSNPGRAESTSAVAQPVGANAAALTQAAPAAANLPAYGPVPLSRWAGSIPARFDTWEVVVAPDRDEAEWWAGAPSVVLEETGTFWLAARMRSPERPKGQRGYELRLFRSDDGVRFTKVHSLRREQVPLPGFERPALLHDPVTGRFKLYACGPLKEDWCIFKFADADRPDQFDPRTARPVIEGRPLDREGVPFPTGYKDPVILHAEGVYHCFVIGVFRLERLYHFTSRDGEVWEPVGDRARSLLDLAGWHSFFVRPASVVPLGVGYLFVYEGSDLSWPDPVYNIATGLGFTFDLHHITDLTPDAPLLVSPTPGRLHVWRYSHWLWVNDQLWVYAEVEKPNGAHEIRLFRLPRSRS
ncbi:MAG: hypothetical protein FJ387_21220 [Verrucomicrobia bacterium]|nr:hypothetical protein [Verrucomicrobiota bacterium]